jgi:Plavaka transposase
MFVPVILGSDKTVMSIGTGNTEYHPLYMSISNVHNGVWRAHWNAVIVVGFLAQPKAERQDANQENFRLFEQQVFHSSLAKILSPLKPAMTTPKVVKCWDGHFRKAIYGIGPYIADYQEQILVSSVVQGWCAKCLILPNAMEQPGITRTCEHSHAVMDAFRLAVAWDEYGISGDIKACTLYLNSNIL